MLRGFIGVVRLLPGGCGGVEGSGMVPVDSCGRPAMPFLFSLLLLGGVGFVSFLLLAFWNLCK